MKDSLFADSRPMRARRAPGRHLRAIQTEWLRAPTRRILPKCRFFSASSSLFLESGWHGIYVSWNTKENPARRSRPLWCLQRAPVDQEDEIHEQLWVFSWSRRDPSTNGPRLVLVKLLLELFIRLLTHFCHRSSAASNPLLCHPPRLLYLTFRRFCWPNSITKGY